MKRMALPLVALALAACEPQVPDSAAGVGFGDYANYQISRVERDRELSRSNSAVPSGPVIGSETIANVDPSIASAPATGAPLSAVPIGNNPGLSDEQDFQAVSSRESIESDAERLARLSQEYQVIQPEALPQRDGSAGPNIVAYALQSSNQLGQSVYRRSNFNAESRFQRACAKYATADEAQRDFLARGGPENDRLGVDPDGDGFACFWDPRPFRAARGG